MTETLVRGVPGMRSAQDMKVLQDMPPPGGFPSVRFGRRIPNTGPTGTAIFGVSALVIAYGFYKAPAVDARVDFAFCAYLHAPAPLRFRELKAEKHAARLALVPVLQAEEDRRYIAARQAALVAEGKLMQHVPGWVPGASPYNSGRWAPPALSLRPSAATS